MAAEANLKSGTDLLEELAQLRRELAALKATIAGLSELRQELAELKAAMPDLAQPQRALPKVPAPRDLILPSGASDDAVETLRQCLDTAVELKDIDCGGTYWVAKETGALHLVAHRGLTAESVAACSHYGAESPHSQQVALGQPSYVSYDELVTMQTEAQAAEGLRTLAVVPIQHEGRTLACLNVASRSADDVPAQARQALETIADRAANAIAHLTTQKTSSPRDQQLRSDIRALSS